MTNRAQSSHSWRSKPRQINALPGHLLHEDAAAFRGISGRTLHRLYDRREGPPRAMFAGRWNYPKEGLQDYVDSLSQESAA